jgi:DNA (cytosine-5)-methyltransferase 1
MAAGDDYPRALRIAEEMFTAALERMSQRPDPESEGWLAARKSFVPPYDPGKFPNKWWKLDPKAPSRTLTAHLGKDSYSHIHWDSDQQRMISVREAARLQSFPDGFRFAGAMNAAFRQIGNAVPPLLAKAVGEHLRGEIVSAATSRMKLDRARRRAA